MMFGGVAMTCSTGGLSSFHLESLPGLLVASLGLLAGGKGPQPRGCFSFWPSGEPWPLAWSREIGYSVLAGRACIAFNRQRQASRTCRNRQWLRVLATQAIAEIRQRPEAGLPIQSSRPCMGASQ